MKNIAMEYKQIDTPINDSVDLWKISRLGLFLNHLQKTINISMPELILLMFLRHFKYVSPKFIYSEKVMGNYKTKRIIVILNKLTNLGILERIDFSIDEQIKRLFPHRVYRLSSHGKKIVDKIHKHLTVFDLSDYLL